jgi:hypothetical protein
LSINEYFIRHNKIVYKIENKVIYCLDITMNLGVDERVHNNRKEFTYINRIDFNNNILNNLYKKNIENICNKIIYNKKLFKFNIIKGINMIFKCKNNSINQSYNQALEFEKLLYQDQTKTYKTEVFVCSTFIASIYNYAYWLTYTAVYQNRLRADRLNETVLKLENYDTTIKSKLIKEYNFNNYNVITPFNCSPYNLMTFNMNKNSTHKILFYDGSKILFELLLLNDKYYIVNYKDEIDILKIKEKYGHELLFMDGTNYYTRNVIKTK